MRVFMLLMLIFSSYVYSQSVDYYPVLLGSAWEYSDGARYEVTGFRYLRNGKKAAVTTLSNCASCTDESHQSNSYVYTDGSTVYSTASIDVEEKYGIITYPVEIGSHWINEDLSGVVCTCYVVAVEDIEVAAGAYSGCAKVEYRDGMLLSTEWLAPNVGIVKMQNGSEVVELRNYSPGS